jgi:hypothetical protein
MTMTTNSRRSMNRRILPPLVAMMAAASLLAGCAPTTTSPTPSPAPTTATPSPTPTVGQVAPAQDQVDAPQSADEAKIAAVKTINLYLGYNFQVLANPELGASYLENYVGEPAATAAATTAKYYLDNKIVAVGGPVTFEPNYGLSYAGVVTDPAAGTTYPDAIVYMIGCADNSALQLSTDGAVPTPATSKTRAPDQFTVKWTPDRKVWRVTDATDLTGQSGAPLC